MSNAQFSPRPSFCPSCGNQVVATAVMCPKCGSPIGSGMARHQEERSNKSRTSYILLAIFFGWLGLHNFYAKISATGVIQLLVSLGTALIGTLVTQPWAIIEAISVTHDGDGKAFC